MSARCLKRPTQIALALFVWHFIVGKPWDSITIIAKKNLCGVHAQVSYIYIYTYIFKHIYICYLYIYMYIYIYIYVSIYIDIYMLGYANIYIYIYIHDRIC